MSWPQSGQWHQNTGTAGSKIPLAATTNTSVSKTSTVISNTNTTATGTGLLPTPPVATAYNSLSSYTAAQFAALTPEQQYAIQQNWQQWQTYHQQYAQWHAQYGEQYQREMQAKLGVVAPHLPFVPPIPTFHPSVMPPFTSVPPPPAGQSKITSAAEAKNIAAATSQPPPPPPPLLTEESKVPNFTNTFLNQNQNNWQQSQQNWPQQHQQQQQQQQFKQQWQSNCWTQPPPGFENQSGLSQQSTPNTTLEQQLKQPPPPLQQQFTQINNPKSYQQQDTMLNRHPDTRNNSMQSSASNLWQSNNRNQKNQNQFNLPSRHCGNKSTLTIDVDNQMVKSDNVDNDNEEKTPEERVFDEQFKKWEEDFENWKKQNANHPDKKAYKEYEMKFEECRRKLLERREQMRRRKFESKMKQVQPSSLERNSNGIISINAKENESGKNTKDQYRNCEENVELKIRTFQNNSNKVVEQKNQSNFDTQMSSIPPQRTENTQSTECTNPQLVQNSSELKFSDGQEKNHNQQSDIKNNIYEDETSAEKNPDVEKQDDKNFSSQDKNDSENNTLKSEENEADFFKQMTKTNDGIPGLDLVSSSPVNKSNNDKETDNEISEVIDLENESKFEENLDRKDTDVRNFHDDNKNLNSNSNSKNNSLNNDKQNKNNSNIGGGNKSFSKNEQRSIPSLLEQKIEKPSFSPPSSSLLDNRDEPSFGQFLNENFTSMNPFADSNNLNKGNHHQSNQEKLAAELANALSNPNVLALLSTTISNAGGDINQLLCSNPTLDNVNFNNNNRNSYSGDADCSGSSPWMSGKEPFQQQLNRCDNFRGGNISGSFGGNNIWGDNFMMNNNNNRNRLNRWQSGGGGSNNGAGGGNEFRRRNQNWSDNRRSNNNGNNLPFFGKNQCNDNSVIGSSSFESPDLINEKSRSSERSDHIKINQFQDNNNKNQQEDSNEQQQQQRRSQDRDRNNRNSQTRSDHSQQSEKDGGNNNNSTISDRSRSPSQQMDSAQPSTNEIRNSRNPFRNEPKNIFNNKINSPSRRDRSRSSHSRDDGYFRPAHIIDYQNKSLYDKSSDRGDMIFPTKVVDYGHKSSRDHSLNAFGNKNNDDGDVKDNFFPMKTIDYGHSSANSNQNLNKGQLQQQGNDNRNTNTNIFQQGGKNQNRRNRNNRRNHPWGNSGPQDNHDNPWAKINLGKNNGDNEIQQQQLSQNNKTDKQEISNKNDKLIEDHDDYTHDKKFKLNEQNNDYEENYDQISENDFNFDERDLLESDKNTCISTCYGSNDNNDNSESKNLLFPIIYKQYNNPFKNDCIANDNAMTNIKISTSTIANTAIINTSTAATIGTSFIDSSKFERKLSPTYITTTSSTMISSSNLINNKNVIAINDILLKPGRDSRLKKICIIIRGPPGSGKTYIAKLIKDKEIEMGGSTPRLLSIDDYFMIEIDKEEKCVKTGKKKTIKGMIYEYDKNMEDNYMQYLIKSFKKTITNRLFDFVIVDCVNSSLKTFNEFYSFAQENGFMPYTIDLLCDLETCLSRNIHNRSENDIKNILMNWNTTPEYCTKLDVTSLLQSAAIQEVEMDISSDNEDEKTAIPENDEENLVTECKIGFLKSKWDTDPFEDKLARLDGTSKPLQKNTTTMEDFLQLDEWDLPVSSSGKKRVRWADIEERRAQEKLRAIGFVVGHTDWNRMMDPSGGSNALTKTKYIERVKK